MLPLYYCYNDVDVLYIISRKYTPQNGWQLLLYCQKGLDVARDRDKKMFFDGKDNEKFGFFDSYHLILLLSF